MRFRAISRYLCLYVYVGDHVMMIMWRKLSTAETKYWKNPILWQLCHVFYRCCPWTLHKEKTLVSLFRMKITAYITKLFRLGNNGEPNDDGGLNLLGWITQRATDLSHFNDYLMEKCHR